MLILLLVAACASQPEAPPPSPESDYTDRVRTQSARGIEVSAAVPSADETSRIFQQDLYRENIQPVWLKIVNRRSEPITFLPVGLDPQYYSPLEAANLQSADDDDVPPESLLNRLFLDQKITLSVVPGDTLSGFIYTRLDEGTKAFNVDFAWDGDFETFTFFIPVPGLAIDHYEVDWENLYSKDEFLDLNAPDLIEVLEGFACCVRDKAGENTGDPLNLVVIGHPRDVYVAFMRAGWDETEVVTRASAWKTFRSFVGGGEYRYSPVSSLYVFDRPQDVAFQKARDNIHQRNHLRLWMSRARYQGLPVWIGQISRDIGVRFTRKTITTHKIDPDVDETREYLLEDLAYSQALRKVGYVKGVGEVSIDQPRGNLTGDPWFTDGYRLVLWVTSVPTPISAVESLDWRWPLGGD
ncbi:MAG: hypothetical protein HKP19_09675 [Xanthomonadales bacterium]|nr:hypothetical protein [Xanthomonadales bacterium]